MAESVEKQKSTLQELMCADVPDEANILSDVESTAANTFRRAFRQYEQSKPFPLQIEAAFDEDSRTSGSADEVFKSFAGDFSTVLSTAQSVQGLAVAANALYSEVRPGHSRSKMLAMVISVCKTTIQCELPAEVQARIKESIGVDEVQQVKGGLQSKAQVAPAPATQAASEAAPEAAAQASSRSGGEPASAKAGRVRAVKPE